jgi:hypothetical protein
LPSTRIETAPAEGERAACALSCATLAGDVVVNRDLAPLGSLRHLMIDLSSGRIAFAVLARGGVFGIGEKLLPIPWRALTLDAEGRHLVLDVPKEKLESAPGFDDEHWPAMADPAWTRQVHEYYGMPADCREPSV